jgi:hypothetical protein
MDNTVLHNISLAQFISFFSDAPCVGIGDDFYMLDVAFTHAHKPLHHPCRIDGFMLLYCIKGKIRMNVNLKEYELSEGMLFMNLPGNIIRVNEIMDVPQEEVRYFCMAISREFSQGLIETDTTIGNISVKGFICKPIYCKPKRNAQYFFLNGRTVRSATMVAALETAYKNMAMVGKFPCCVLHVDMPLDAVDVNVHPAKTEVRFANEKPLFEAVYVATKNALEKGELHMQKRVNNTHFQFPSTEFHF